MFQVLRETRKKLVFFERKKIGTLQSIVAPKFSTLEINMYSFPALVNWSRRPERASPEKTSPEPGGYQLGRALKNRVNLSEKNSLNFHGKIFGGKKIVH